MEKKIQFNLEQDNDGLFLFDAEGYKQAFAELSQAMDDVQVIPVLLMKCGLHPNAADLTSIIVEGGDYVTDHTAGADGAAFMVDYLLRRLHEFEEHHHFNVTAQHLCITDGSIGVRHSLVEDLRVHFSVRFPQDLFNEIALNS